MNTASIANRIARLGAVAAAIVMPLSTGLTPVRADAEAPPDNRYVLPFSILDGNPDFEHGQGMGYWIWRDKDGLHLRTTTHGIEHDFNGALRTSDNSQFVNVKPYRLEDQGSNDDRLHIDSDKDTIRFHFDTWAGTDGFDFRLDGRTFCVELENNGHEATDATHLGRDEVRPNQLPVCFRRQA
jgi:hypothetical protein